MKLSLTADELTKIATEAHRKGKLAKVPTDLLMKLVVDHGAALGKLHDLGVKGTA